MMHAMPTKNPRLTVTLEPVLAVQLRRLAELTGNSQSKILSELLEGSTEVFAKSISVLEAAKLATASMRGKVVDDMTEAHAVLERQLGLNLDVFDAVADPFLAEVAAAAKPESTPISNRGVRSVKRKTKVPKKQVIQ